MEALGQLTGGIAHDFNNLLTVILGNLDRALRSTGEGEPIRRNLGNALTAAERAAHLTDQLLTFARKQKVVVTPHDVNAIVGNLCSLIERTLGEQIRLEAQLGDRLPPVRIDRNQLENALLNLAINARDAMPEGGVLTLSTSIEEHGRVQLAIADTGSGMDEQTLRRATEPFYTTKPVGQGTGLGLSQVYGFVTQAGGELRIDSRPGKGTTIRLCFPPDGDCDGEDPAGGRRDARARARV
jgi:signal transduction histidine kinase